MKVIPEFISDIALNWKIISSTICSIRDKECSGNKQCKHDAADVLAAYADECGITKEQALKLGGCLGSGMRKGEVCGACTGALMVLGLLFGQSDKEDLTSRRRSDEVNDRMMDLFAQKSGSYLCREIIGYDISTEEAKKYAREHHLYANCHEMVGNAVDALEEILQKNN